MWGGEAQGKCHWWGIKMHWMVLATINCFFHVGSVASTDIMYMITVAWPLMRITAWDDHRDQGRCPCHPWNLHCQCLPYPCSLYGACHPWNLHSSQEWNLHFTLSLFLAQFTAGTIWQYLMHTVNRASQYLLLGSFKNCSKAHYYSKVLMQGWYMIHCIYSISL